MEEHSKAKVEEFLLEGVEGFVLSVGESGFRHWYVGDEGGRGEGGGGLEEFASGGHGVGLV